MSNTISGSRLVVEALKQEGVDTIFGYPGGVVIPLFDALYDEPAIRIVLTRHEQGAVHAADGYARSSGKPGVCIVTSGPGATNTTTGLATANFDSVPLICISGQVPSSMIGNDAFQEADTVGITRPVTKHNYLIISRAELGRTIKEAFYIATSGRPGPVVIDIPKDVFIAEGDVIYPDSVSIRGYNPTTSGHAPQIKRAADALLQAKKPLFFIGGGLHISDGTDIFRDIQKKTGIPVVSSLMGIGCIPSNHQDYLGMIGMHGTFAANNAVMETDLLFSIGVRFDDRATGELSKFAPHATIARNVRVDVPIVGDARLVLEEMARHAHATEIGQWKQRVSEWKRQHPPEIITSGSRLNPQEIVNLISEAFPDAIVSSEVGQNQMWAALFYSFKNPRTWLTSGGLGTMGYGFPAAIGAQIAFPEKRVVDIAGDGSIQMNIQELATAVAERLPVIIAVLNNGYLGMVRQWQELFFKRRYSASCLARNSSCPVVCSEPGEQCPVYSPDFVALAKAYGAEGFRASTLNEAKEALKKAKSITDRPILIDFLIPREANVWPIVPPGAGLGEMILQEGATQ